MNNINISNTQPLSDIYLAAYLMCDIPLVDALKVNATKYEFLFEDTEQLRAEVENYYKNRAVCNPQDLFANFKRLKNIIHQRNNNAF